jgi:hypothetical protein
MLKKMQNAGARFAETPVSHHERTYGISSYTPLRLLKERLFGDLRLYFSLRKSV